MVDEIEYEDYEDLPLYWIGYNDGWEDRIKRFSDEIYVCGYDNGCFDREYECGYRDVI